jgi:hypothetical protein
MAEKTIILYTVGVVPPIGQLFLILTNFFNYLVPYRDFFMSLAYITGGQYVPLVDANLLAQVIIGGSA